MVAIRLVGLSVKFLLFKTSQSVTAYTILCEKYKQFIDRDPQYLEYLDKIGQNYFGIPPPVKARPGGMFSGRATLLPSSYSSNWSLPCSLGIFDQLLSAMTEDSEEEEGPAVAGPSRTASGPSRKLQQDDLD